MDADFLIDVAHALTIAGAVVLVVGLLTMFRSQPSGWATACAPVWCNRCSANRLQLITPAHACLKPVQRIERQ
jgi:hypothetical protein